MIPLTQLNGSRIYINSGLIESFESTPDTVLTLTTGKKVMVKETPEEVIQRVIEFEGRLNDTSRDLDEEVAQWT